MCLPASEAYATDVAGCNKTLVAAAGKEEVVQKMCMEVMVFSQQQMQDKTQGICEFTCHQDNYEPNTFHFWERYDTNRHMGQHMTQAPMQQFMEKVQDHLEGPVGMALYEWQNGQLGHACVHGGPKGEGGLDDATGAGGAGGASMKQTSSTVDLTKESAQDEEKGLWGMKGMKLPVSLKFPWQKDKATAGKN
eukprot:jgi/Astpho2/4779/Aster-00323